MTLSEERKNLCEQGRALRKKVINFKRPFKSTIQEYKKVDCILKKEVKKVKRKKLDEKIKTLKDHLKKNNSHNLFRSLREQHRKPKKSLTVVKNQQKDNGTKTEVL